MYNKIKLTLALAQPRPVLKNNNTVIRGCVLTRHVMCYCVASWVRIYEKASRWV